MFPTFFNKIELGLKIRKRKLQHRILFNAIELYSHTQFKTILWLARTLSGWFAIGLKVNR